MRRFGIIGGGPAGLYTAILLKRDDPSREVRLVERNPEGATYGWGVVFSADTLAELRDADYEAYLRLDEHLTRWDALDVRYRGTVTRALGHGFSAIPRAAMLQVLTTRARELGVDLEFEHEAPGIAAFEDADVVVAADGVNSDVRTEHAEAFGTRIEEMTTRFAWFGASRAFEAFTFIFEETEHGLFTVHAYPIDAGTSTFIVECRPETWRSAGLDQASEEDSLAFCEELFAGHLDGAELLSNRSIWLAFQTVRNRRWHHDNVVLAGDAAATAHFTIGSGTKLAVEDAAALARAFTEHPDDRDAAFTAYELDRQTPTERFQDAAGDSARWFANVGRYLGLDPEQLTFNLLTRSGRVTHRDVDRRDPVLATQVDRWFAAHAAPRPVDVRGSRHNLPRGTDIDRLVVGPPSRQPLRLRELTVGNRVSVAPAPDDTAEQGAPGAATLTRLRDAAGTGAGVVVSDLVAVSPEGRVTPGSPGLYDDGHTTAWTEIADAVHDAGALLAVRLGHAGRRGATRRRTRFLDRPLPADEAWELLAPSPLPYLTTSAVPREATPEDLDRLTAAFVAATQRATAAGVDLVVVDASDGYLLASFLSPLTNQREDEFGGDHDRRLRWPLAVVEAVRGTLEADRPLAVRLNADDRRADTGITPDEAVEVARRLVQAGVDLIDVVSGHSVPWFGGAEYRRGWRIELADRIRNEAGVPTIASGAITTLDEVDTAVAAGRADLCVLDTRRYREPRQWPL